MNMSRMVLIAGTVLSCIVCNNNPIFARSLQLSDLHSTAHFKDKIVINKDLSYSVESLICETLLDDSDEAIARGTQSYQVDLGVSKLESLIAWTEKNGKKYPLDETAIHKGIASASLSGFRDIEKHTFSYPLVSEGSKLCQQIRTHHKPPIKGYLELVFSSYFPYLEKGSEITVESEVPLHTWRRDKQKFWSYHHYTKNSATGERFIYDFKLLKSYSDEWIFENQSDNVNVDSPVAILRNCDSYDSQPFRELYQEINSRADVSEIPQTELVDFRNSISEKLTVKQKTEKTIAWINDRIRYMGDWRTSDSRFIPRSIQQIFETGYGDCKDFSLLTITLLRGLGISADFALVRRGYPEKPMDLNMEQSLYMSVNHAIVWIHDDAGGFAVDPTNVAAVATALPDIMNRQVLVPGPSSAMIHRTPDYLHTDSGISEVCQIVPENSSARIRCTEEYRGIDQALLLQENFRNHRSVNERSIIELNTDQYDWYKFYKIPEFWERVPQPYQLDFEWSKIRSWTVTPAGEVLYLSQPFANIIDLKSEVRVSGIRLPLINFRTTRIYKHMIATHALEELNCGLRSRWFDIERTVRQDQSDLIITQHYRTKNNRITAKEFGGSEFASLLSKWNQCFRNKGVILKHQK
ncbi:MAG: transglutaminase family protein [Deltaproteobacteria bacterium]|nr:transglutaminase family protein [Deltaproteobacteria bacterium]